ncbi:hypothetical protein IQ260_27330 [Leptolyngbya cf. ectocarpi LEGE 11479]|uniref:Uncharacterized protein n=1 Tax=Leptolyngbya cf. ectocarpi LEGE 11479 TaxID=1828722 RepID=A0A928ZZP0_LEPEC|nr:hypothetical protein [Leptolyngbya ectocarpi]MBE9070361.1 hypothetical protein [Leptolyngbya cf. ectocarpi LEGE 11479]
MIDNEQRMAMTGTFTQGVMAMSLGGWSSDLAILARQTLLRKLLKLG